MLAACLRITVMVFLTIGMVVTGGLWYLYKLKTDGVIFLQGIEGNASISRELDTGIAHIRGSNFHSTLYAQGFAHAQTRLWKLEATRRVFSGTASEIFGKDALPVDKFTRSIGYKRLAQETYDNLKEEDKALLQAYANGINAFIKSVDFSDSNAGAKIFPPEFYVFGLADKIEPWHPTDSLALSRLISFHLTWNFAQDFSREVVRQAHPDFQNLWNQIMPYETQHLHNLVTILDDEDLKEMDSWSEETLQERHNKGLEDVKRASPPKDWQFDEEPVKNDIPINPVSDDAGASNSWVVHGDHTETGFPMLANDPHLGTALPAFWQLQEFIWDDGYASGASVPGMPMIVLGRTKTMSWGITASLNDISDLWQEEISENGKQYRVDGEWRNLDKRTEVIKVKGEQDVVLNVGITHRGPIVGSDIVAGGAVLFGGSVPNLKETKSFSLGWGFNRPSDHLLEAVNMIREPEMSVNKFMDYMLTKDEPYIGLPANLILADTFGDIAYMMLSPSPIRKNKTPFIGSRILDGRTSEFDWEGFAPIKDLPRSFNPKKGYIVTANNRQVPDNSIFDHGAAQMSTGRAQRIDEMLHLQIASGKKFTLEDVAAIQQDVTDIPARDAMPLISKITKSMLNEFSVDEKADIESMLEHLDNWKGTFAETDVGATIYSYWQLNFYRSLFHKQLPKDLPGSLAEHNRMAFSDNYQFIDFYQKAIRSISENPTSEINMVCQGAYENYTGDKACAYNMARAFLETKSFLNKNLGWSSDNWMWRNVHSNEYPNTPWSKTPLRPLFHREIPTPGNTNTPNVAKISTKKASDANRFVSTHAANLKFAIQMHEDPKQEINLYSIDTGNGQNIFQANYFDMNRAHLDGNLHNMYLGADIQNIKTETLIIKPKSAENEKPVEGKEAEL